MSPRRSMSLSHTLWRLVYIGLFWVSFIYGQNSFPGAVTGQDSCPEADRRNVRDITNIRTRFLVFVGEEYNNCNATVATDYIQAGQNWTVAPTIYVGKCDDGKFMYRIEEDTHTKNLTVYVSYYTKAYSIGPPPSCQFQWKGDYQVPTQHNMKLSPLPGCYYQFRDKEYYKSYFMFQMLMWQWS